MEEHYEQLAWVTGQTNALVTMFSREGNKALSDQIDTYSQEELGLLVAALVITVAKFNEMVTAAPGLASALAEKAGD